MKTLLCIYCNEPLDQGDLPIAEGHHDTRRGDLPCVPHDPTLFGPGGAAGCTSNLHRECFFRILGGSVAHQLKRCACYGGEDAGDPPGMTLREGARAALREFRTQQSLLN